MDQSSDVIQVKNITICQGTVVLGVNTHQKSIYLDEEGRGFESRRWIYIDRFSFVELI